MVIKHGSGDWKHMDLVFAIPGLKESLGNRTESSSEESSGSILVLDKYVPEASRFHGEKNINLGQWFLCIKIT